MNVEPSIIHLTAFTATITFNPPTTTFRHFSPSQHNSPYLTPSASRNVTTTIPLNSCHNYSSSLRSRVITTTILSIFTATNIT